MFEVWGPLSRDKETNKLVRSGIRTRLWPFSSKSHLNLPPFRSVADRRVSPLAPAEQAAAAQEEKMAERPAGVTNRGPQRLSSVMER